MSRLREGHKENLKNYRAGSCGSRRIFLPHIALWRIGRLGFSGRCSQLCLMFK